MSQGRGSLCGMTESLDCLIASIAAAQHGIFTAADADAVGFNRNHRDGRIRAGRWCLAYPGVYRMAGAPVSWRGRLLAACWAPTGLAAASHRSAAALWALPGGCIDTVEITCHRWQRAFADGIVVHETELLSSEDVMAVDGIPATSVEQTLLGLAAVASPTVVEMALDRALRLELTTRQGLDAFVERKGARGRNGIGVIRELLRIHDPLAGMPESAMETKLKRVLRADGLPTPEFQYVIRHEGRFIARVDAAYPDLRIAIEFDSYEHHTGKLALVRDTGRRNQLLGIRWQTVTFTAADLARHGGQAIEALRVARAQARSGVTRAG